ncbi:MAG: cytochrome ubiquinol oxidase subunit I [Desulfofustis sp. PB-SRB1]|nr:cytochrome ubiquinol oxidase subunit I [Desulfofustis sp. PB-SRB1]
MIGWPNAEKERIDFDISIPGGLSFMVFDDLTFSKPVVGLDRFRPEDRPPLLLSYLSWRVMVGIGVLMIAACALGIYYNWRKTLPEKRWLLWSLVVGIVFVMASNQAGWIGAEVGRQPWIVHPPVIWNEDGTDLVVGEDGFYQYDEAVGLRTVHAVSPSVNAAEATTSLILFLVLYLSLAAVWIMVLDSKIRKGPEEYVIPEQGDEHGVKKASAARQHARLDNA